MCETMQKQTDIGPLIDYCAKMLRSYIKSKLCRLYNSYIKFVIKSHDINLGQTHQRHINDDKQNLAVVFFKVVEILDR